MSITKNKREQKKQLGQFLTPPDLAARILDKIDIDVDSVVLEPSFGKWGFYICIHKQIGPKRC